MSFYDDYDSFNTTTQLLIMLEYSPL
jgi:hypothetical protein